MPPAVPYSNPASYQQWAQDLEVFMGLPETPQETTLISAWEQAENPVSQVGGYTSHGGYNALNTSLKTGSSGLEPGSSFIPTFPNITAALSATASTLEQSNYAPELQALQAQSDQGLVNALGAPGHVWGTSPSLVASILHTGPSTKSVGTGGGPTAQTASFPGGSLDPLNIPGEIAGAGGSAVASGILGVLNAITAPLKAFVVNSSLVVFGVILLAVAVIVIAHSASSGGSTQVIRETVRSSSEGEGEDEDEEGEEHEGGEHEGEEGEHREETTHTTERVTTPKAKGGSSSSAGAGPVKSQGDAQALESEAQRAPEAVAEAAAA